jgi:hypothetical protein
LGAAGSAATTTNKKIPMENSFKQIPLEYTLECKKVKSFVP